jgi:hypothetical protein
MRFELGTSDWRHDGMISGDTMSGRFWLQNPSLRLEGSFQAILEKPASNRSPTPPRQP